MDFSQQQILSNRLQDKLPELTCVSHCQLASLLYQLVDGLISFWVMQKIRNIIHGSIGKLKLDFITLCTPLCTAKQGLTSLQGFLSFFFTLLSTNKTMNCLYFKNIYKKTVPQFHCLLLKSGFVEYAEAIFIKVQSALYC